MTLRTLLEFLIGRRAAIEEVAQTPSAIWLGLLFVLSAGFAREYDGEDLLHEPWHLLLPLAASLVTSTVLYGLLWLVLRGWRTFPQEHRWRSFLTCYWLTAPLAWTYAIPVERFLSAGDATSANLWFLVVVAVWRVALMIRVVSVLFRAPVWKAAATVLFFADVVLLVVLRLTPIPLLAIMGGVRLSESEMVLQSTSLVAGLVAFVSFPLLLIGIASAATMDVPSSTLLTASQPTTAKLRAGWPVWALAIVSLLIWIPILPAPQAEQRLRYQAEQGLNQGRIAEALRAMSQREPGEYPPHWDPPPRIAYARIHPPLLDVVDQALEPGVQEWVREVYVRKYYDVLNGRHHAIDNWQECDETTFSRRLAILERLPANTPEFTDQLEALGAFLRYQPPSPAARDRMVRLFARAGKELPMPTGEGSPNPIPTIKLE